MRKVRPGEIPQPLSIWQWREHGNPLLVLGLELKPSSWGGRYHIAVLRLSTGKIDDAIWTGNAHVGMGPVLEDWYEVEGAPEVSDLDDIADSDGRLAPIGLR